MLVLGGISRLMKPYFKVFQTLDDFKHRKFLTDLIYLVFVGNLEFRSTKKCV